MSASTDLHLRPGGRPRVLQGHPWVFAGELAEPTGEAPAPEDGGEVRLLDSRGRFLGRGLFNSASSISLRLFTRRDQPLDEGFFRRRIQEAAAHRERLAPGLRTLRMVFSEGDRLPGLVVDRYEDVLVTQLLTLPLDQRRDLLHQLLLEELRPRAIFERSDASVRGREGLLPRSGPVHGEVPEDLEVEVAGLKMAVDIPGGQKTGLFLDQRENYGLARWLAPGRDVLDCFSHTGGFALSAAAGGARSVTAVESSQEALAALERNARANALSGLVDPLCENAFDTLRRLDRQGCRYGLVILDPPSFCRGKKTLPRALRGYNEINLRALRILEPGGCLITCSCSYHVTEPIFREMLLGAARDAQRQVRTLAIRAQSLDHPRLLAVPETHYLKLYVLEAL